MWCVALVAPAEKRAQLALPRLFPADARTPSQGRLINVLYKTWYAPSIFFQTAYLWDPTSAIVMLYPSVVLNTTTVPLKVVSTQGGWDNADQGATRICSAAEQKVAGACANVSVTWVLDGTAVSNLLLALMESPINSAVRPLYCPLADAPQS